MPLSQVSLSFSFLLVDDTQALLGEKLLNAQDFCTTNGTQGIGPTVQYDLRTRNQNARGRMSNPKISSHLDFSTLVAKNVTVDLAESRHRLSRCVLARLFLQYNRDCRTMLFYSSKSKLEKRALSKYSL